MVRRYSEQKIRDNNFNARNEDKSLQGAAAWKGNPRGNPEGNAQRSKVVKMESVVNGPRKDYVREETRAASSTM